MVPRLLIPMNAYNWTNIQLNLICHHTHDFGSYVRAYSFSTYSFDGYSTIPDGRQRMQKKREKKSKDNSRSSRKKTCKHNMWEWSHTQLDNGLPASFFSEMKIEKQKTKNTHAQVYVCWTPDKPHTFTQPTNLPTHNGWEERKSTQIQMVQLAMEKMLTRRTRKHV